MSMSRAESPRSRRPAAGDGRLRSLLRLSLGLGYSVLAWSAGSPSLSSLRATCEGTSADGCLVSLPRARAVTVRRCCGGLMARGDRSGEEWRSWVQRWGEPRVPAREVGCAIRSKEVCLQALSGQQGRGNFPRTLWPSQPATWETRAVGVALRSVTEKSGSDPWPSSISSGWVELSTLPPSPPPLHQSTAPPLLSPPTLLVCESEPGLLHTGHRGKRIQEALPAVSASLRRTG